jgi:hypothetical protein
MYSLLLLLMLHFTLWPLFCFPFGLDAVALSAIVAFGCLFCS